MSDPFAPLNNEPAASRAKPGESWEVIVPLPHDALPPPAEHYARGKPAMTWTYRDGAGRLLGLVWRFDGENGGKEFLPLTYCRRTDGAGMAWRFKSWPAPRSLYGLQKLAMAPSAAILICEGEKTADAAQRLFPDLVAITSAGGSKAAGKADWSPLKGRDVVIWPDNDEAGQFYAEEVAHAALNAGAVSAVIIAPPRGKPQGWDAADAETEGLASEALQALVASAKSFDPRSGEAPTTGTEPPERKRPRQSNELIALVDRLRVELWTNPEGEAYASFPVAGHFENRALRSQEFRRWMAGQSYMTTGGVPSVQALEDSLRVLEARAVIEGGTFKTYRRVGEAGGKIYLDLCDEKWRAVEIDGFGWRVMANPPCKFIRGAAMRPMVLPELGGSVDALRGFFNIESDADFQLLVAWMVQALRPRGPYPVLCINGEQGSGKSNLTMMLRALTDPNASPLRSASEKDRDLFIAAENSWVLALDNLSGVAEWLSDTLCRIASGGGFSTRTLHSDKEETFFYLSRPCILNGIPALTNRPDLADRAITLFLKAIPDDKRRTEEEFWHEFDKVAPEILGALLDGVSAGLRNLAGVKLEQSPRMADFARWTQAAESGLGFEPGSILAAYLENRKEVFEATFEADAVAVALANLARAKGGIECKPSELLDMLNATVSDKLRNSRHWPQNATAFGSRFSRIMPMLRKQGFSVDRGLSGNRYCSVMPMTD
jgi:putative DNA primase/helicase